MIETLIIGELALNYRAKILFFELIRGGWRESLHTFSNRVPVCGDGNALEEESVCAF